MMAMKITKNRLALAAATPLILAALCAAAVGETVRDFPAEIKAWWNALGADNDNL